MGEKRGEGLDALRRGWNRGSYMCKQVDMQVMEEHVDSGGKEQEENRAMGKACNGVVGIEVHRWD